MKGLAARFPVGFSVGFHSAESAAEGAVGEARFSRVSSSNQRDNTS